MGRQGTWVVPGPSGILDRGLWGGHLRTDERRLVPPFPGTPALGDPLPAQSRGPHTHFLCPEPLPQPLLSGQCYRCSHFCDSSTGSAPWWEGLTVSSEQWPTRLPSAEISSGRLWSQCGVILFSLSFPPQYSVSASSPHLNKNNKTF